MASNKNKPPEYNPPFFGPGKLSEDMTRMVSTSRNGFSDTTNSYANQGYYVEFEYIHGETSINKVAFKSFITDYQDNFNSNWNSEEVYGRPDPIYTFQNTTRVINLSWDVPSADFTEAEQNLAKASKLMRFLYPSYTQEGNVSTLTKPPLLRLKFTNLAKKNSTQGLLGKAAGFSFTPDLEAGWWDGNPREAAGGQGQLYPKLLKFTCEFSVIHEHHLGWHDCDGKWEVVCGEDGKERLDPDKKVWPFIPFDSSASAGQILNSPEFDMDLDAILGEDDPAQKALQDLERAKRSNLGVNSTTSTDKPTAIPVDPPPGQTPRDEEEAELKGSLGT